MAGLDFTDIAGQLFVAEQNVVVAKALRLQLQPPLARIHTVREGILQRLPAKDIHDGSCGVALKALMFELYFHIDSCLVEVRTKVHLPLMGRRRSEDGTFSSHLGDVFVPAGEYLSYALLPSRRFYVVRLEALKLRLYALAKLGEHLANVGLIFG